MILIAASLGIGFWLWKRISSEGEVILPTVTPVVPPTDEVVVPPVVPPSVEPVIPEPFVSFVRIYGKVTDSNTGKPLSNAWVSFSSLSGVIGGSTRADSNGIYYLQFGPEGGDTYDITANLAGYEGVTYQDIFLDMTAVARYDFSLKPILYSVLKGKVTDKVTGEPIFGVTITAKSIDTGKAYNTHSDSNGYYSLSVVPPSGVFDITFFKPDYARYDYNSWLLPSVSETVLDVRMEKGYNPAVIE